MTRTARLLVAVAALFMSAAYVLPLWRISLIAPQYPEGLGMLIRINTVVGAKESDLQSINGLNHYIGMKTIEPNAIPELRFMPIILGVLVLTGLGIAALGKRIPFVAWSIALALVLAAGLADYWKWGYDYGHDLSPTAIIKIEGMTYQPPLIGSKQLLNFRATSWPASGGWLLVLGSLLVAVALIITLRHWRNPTLKMAAAAAVVATAMGCAVQAPRAFALGQDGCEFCRMSIVDSRFGGEAVTKTGKVLTFDSIECLASFARTVPAGTMRGYFVMDLQHPGTFVSADSAGFLKGVLVHTPMGRSIVSLASRRAAQDESAVLGGRVMTWAELVVDSATERLGAR